MDPASELVSLTTITCAGFILIAYNRKGLIDKALFELIGYFILAFPPLIPLVQVLFNSGINMIWYLLPYILVGIGIFVIWILDKKGEKKTRSSYICGICMLIIWIIFGLLVFQRILQ